MAIKVDTQKLAHIFALRNGTTFANASAVVDAAAERATRMADLERGRTLRITSSHRSPSNEPTLRPVAPVAKPSPSTTAPPAIGLRSLSLQIAKERRCGLGEAQQLAEAIINRQRASLPPTPHAGPPVVSLRELAHKIASQEGCTMGAAQLRAEEIFAQRKGA